MSLRRTRIKASSAHLASLAGKRRGANNKDAADEIETKESQLVQKVPKSPKKDKNSGQQNLKNQPEKSPNQVLKSPNKDSSPNENLESSKKPEKSPNNQVPSPNENLESSKKTEKSPNNQVPSPNENLESSKKTEKSPNNQVPSPNSIELRSSNKDLESKEDSDSDFGSLNSDLGSPNKDLSSSRDLRSSKRQNKDLIRPNKDLRGHDKSPNASNSKATDSVGQVPDASPNNNQVPTTTAVEDPHAKPRLFLKGRFRPNLSESDQQRGRLRRVSGCESLGSPGPAVPMSPGFGPGRTRTISGSSSDFDFSRRTKGDHQAEVQALPGECEFVATPPPPSRIRRLTESSGIGQAPKDLPTVFDQRKADYKKKFGEGTPERTRIKMFDLIYYNPADGNRMSNASSLRSSRAASIDGQGGGGSLDDSVPNRLSEVVSRLEEEAVDNNLPEEESLPVPQVKVGPDGSLVVDETSTLIETTAAKKAKEDLLGTPLVFETANQATNYGSWGKKKKTADWSTKETVRFYQALSVFGTDFSMMEGVFKRRSRHELKMKFKKEEKAHRGLVDKCLTRGMKFDASLFDSESDEEVQPPPEGKTKGNDDQAAKVKRKRKHRIKQGRGYYEESDDDADESEIASESEAAILDTSTSSHNPGALEGQEILPDRVQPRRKSKDVSRLSTPMSPPAMPVPAAKRPRTDGQSSDSLLKSLLQSKSGEASSPAAAPHHAAFPPALLAANPGLANASPGSLVLVASPSPASIGSPSNQLMHVYMVGEAEEAAEEAPESEKPRRTRTISESHLDTTSVGRVRTHSGTAPM